MRPDDLPVVIPSGMRFYTPLPGLLVEKNPSLARDVIRALNIIDRSRNRLYRQVIGDLKVDHG